MRRPYRDDMNRKGAEYVYIPCHVSARARARTLPLFRALSTRGDQRGFFSGKITICNQGEPFNPIDNFSQLGRKRATQRIGESTES